MPPSVAETGQVDATEKRGSEDHRADAMPIQMDWPFGEYRTDGQTGQLTEPKVSGNQPIRMFHPERGDLRR